VNVFQRALTVITKALPSFNLSRYSGGMSTVAGSGGWYSLVRESFAGAWQRNITLDRRDGLMSNSTIYACTTRIANDISKLPINLVEEVEPDIWEVVRAASPFWPALRKPNKYQNRIQFYVVWLLSKLMYGNTYVLKIRDERGIVFAMHILSPTRVAVAVAPNGEVWYQLSQDDLAGIKQQFALPASEIIHDRMNPLFHPLCGIPPLFAAALTATQGARAQQFAAKFFENMARPSGVLVTPGELSTEKQKEYKEAWESGFSGDNIGRIAVMGGGLKFEAIGWPAIQSQLVEQLEWGVADIARAYGMPLHKIQAGPVPTSNNVEALNQDYYQDCLQPHIESIELCLDEGLELTDVAGRPRWTLGTEFDLDNLLRMDSATQITSLATGTGAGIYSINEARKKRNLRPAAGGGEPILQQQNWPLSQIANRELPKREGETPAPGTPIDDAANDDESKALFDSVIAKFNQASIMKALANG